MKIDINKKYRTRDGREVIIHATDGPRFGLPVVASLATEDGWLPYQWPNDGRHPHGQTTDDLIEVREPREWTMYADKDQYSHLPFLGACRIRVREIID